MASNAGVNSAATQEANQQQANITANVNSIQNAYNSTATNQSYAQFAKALTSQYQAALQRQQQLAQRNMNFALARSGLSGGSVAANQGGLLNQESQLATLGAQQQVQQQVAGLQQQNAQTEAQEISMAQSGGYLGDAAAQTSAALEANLNNAENSNVANGLGQAFAQTANTVTNMQNAQALRSGMQSGLMYSSPFGSTGSGPAAARSAP